MKNEDTETNEENVQQAESDSMQRLVMQETVTLPKDCMELIYNALSMGQEYAKEVIIDKQKKYGRDTIFIRKALELAEVDREIILGAQEIAAKCLT